MQIKIDTIADALYIKLKKSKVSKTEDRGDYLVDYDGKGKLVGFEVLNLSKKVPAGERGLTSMVDDRKVSLAG
jgi:uncharacterized protein YuzE